MSPASTSTHTPPGNPKHVDLFVNDGELDDSDYGFLQSTDPKTTSMKDMRASLAENGYLFLKGILPRQDVLDARKRYFEFFSSIDFLRPGTEPVDGIFNMEEREAAHYPGFGAGPITDERPEVRRFVDRALQAHYEEWYQEGVVKHPKLLKFVSELTGWGSHTKSLDRTLLRNNVPGNKAIGVHYDYIFLRHGEDTVLTAWIPMGDIKLEGGGLIYLEKGHELGQEIESSFSKKAVESGMTDEEAKFAYNKNMKAGGVLGEGAKAFGRQHNKRWLVTDYEAGDVVIHNSYMIHASTLNCDKDQVIRLGTDLRYVNTGRPWDTRWGKPIREGDML